MDFCSTRSRLPHVKRKVSLSRVRVDGRCAPMHLVCSGQQRLKADMHDSRAGLSFALINLCAVGISHLDGAERWLQTFREPKRDFGRRCLHGGAGAWLCMVQRGVSLGSAGSEQAKQSRYGDDEYSHGLPYAYRQPDWGAV